MKHTPEAKAKIGAASRARNSAAIATAARWAHAPMGCKVEGCAGKHAAQGLCSMHYQRLRKHGATGGCETQMPGTYVSAYGYRFINGQPEHVQVAERALGKRMPPGAIVHHINEDTLDNRKENLVICQDRAYHNLIHARMRALSATGNADWMLCPFCGNYDDRKNLYVYPNRNAAKHRECYRSYIASRAC